MDITGVNRIMIVPNAPAPVEPPAKAVEHRPVVQAIRSLNAVEMFGKNYLRFQLDPSSKRMVIQVVDKETSEVVGQIPEEYVLRLAEDLKAQQANTGSDKIG